MTAALYSVGRHYFRAASSLAHPRSFGLASSDPAAAAVEGFFECNLRRGTSSNFTFALTCSFSYAT